MPEPLTSFQEACLTTLREVADRSGVGVRETGRSSPLSDAAVEVEVGAVPIELTAEAVSIRTRYNGRTFQLSSYESEGAVLSDCASVVDDFVRRPYMASHPITRFLMGFLQGGPRGV